MNREPGPIEEADLQAYVDGYLDEQRHTQVEAYLAAHPDEAQRVRDYQAINRSLQQLFEDVLDEPLPPRLKHPHTPRFRSLLKVASIAGWLLLGGMAGWLGRGTTLEETRPAAALVHQALAAHAVYTPEVRHPVEVDAAQEAHLVAWLSKRLGAPIRAPQLNPFGYQLLGGRLLPADGKPAAQFMYQDASGKRLTLFVRIGMSKNPETAFRFAHQDGTSAFYWIDRELGYALVGSLEKPLLADIAQAVYQQFNP